MKDQNAAMWSYRSWIYWRGKSLKCKFCLYWITASVPWFNSHTSCPLQIDCVASALLTQVISQALCHSHLLSERVKWNPKGAQLLFSQLSFQNCAELLQLLFHAGDTLPLLHHWPLQHNHCRMSWAPANAHCSHRTCKRFVDTYCTQQYGLD